MAVTLVVALLAPGVRGQEPAMPTVASLVTVGPGSTAVSAFGHSMILFEAPADTVAFSFGQSDYAGMGLLVRALQGAVEAGAGEIDWATARDAYLSAGRTIWIQRLALLPEQVERLRSELRRSVGFFYYATFDDNCTTTLRDALDHATSGAIRAQTSDAAASGSLRDRVRPMTEAHPSVAALAALLLTDRVDGPASRWDAMFLPETLRAGLREVTVPAFDGARTALVTSERVLGPAPRERRSAGIPPWLSALALGLAAGSAVAVLGPRAGAGGRPARVFETIVAGWALIAGLTGVVLVMVGFSPDPAFSLLNENLFHLNPAWLGVAIAGWGSHPDLPAARRLAAVLAVLSSIGLLLEILPSFDQANLAVTALAVPANVGLALGLARWSRARPSGRPRP